MAVGVEPKEEGIMNRRPRHPLRPVLTKVTWAMVSFQAFMICALTIALYLIDLKVLSMTLESTQSVVSIETVFLT